MPAIRTTRDNHVVADDELDLFELIHNLWVRKYLIGFCVFVSVLLAAAYAWYVPEKWRSVAYVSKPRVNHMYDYLEQRRVLARADSNQPVDRGELAASLFREFLRQASSEISKISFMQTSPYITQLAQEKSPEDLVYLLDNAVKQLVITLPDDEPIEPYYQLAFTADTATDAQKILSDYLAYANDLAVKILDAEFRDALQASILSRRTERNIIERQLLTNRSNWVSELQAALATARAAGVTSYMGGRTITASVVVELSDSQRLFMLGETFLEAELQTAQESPIIYPLRFYEIEEQLALLEPLLDYAVGNVQAYRYQLAPTLPVQRESPKRLLILLLGAVLGGLAGVFLVLIQSAVLRRQDELSLLRLHSYQAAALKSPEN